MANSDEILERIRKRREELEGQNEVISLEKDEDTGDASINIDFDKMSLQDKSLLKVNAIRNGYKNDNYELGKTKADEVESTLLKNATRDELVDYYKAFTNDSAQAIHNSDVATYYRDEILKTRIKNKLGDTASDLTILQDTWGEISGNVMGTIADTANIANMGYVALTDNLDADTLYSIATSKERNAISNTKDGKKNWNLLQELKEKNPNDKVIEKVYDSVVNQNYNLDKESFNTMVKYINQQSNTQRFEQFQRAHTLDETQKRENLKLKESMSRYGKATQFALDTVGMLSYMAPSLALGAGVGSAIGNGVTTKAGTQILSQTAGREIAKQVGLTSMGLAAAGNSATQTLAQGYEWNQALRKGITDGMIEYVTELIGGEAVNKFLVGTKTSVTPLGKLIGKGIDTLGIKNKWLKLGISALGDVTAEAWEEMIGEAISPLLDQKLLGKKITDWEQYGIDIFRAGFQSILPTLILGGLNRVQVSQKIKSQMEAMTLSVETNPYISQEQKDKLLKGIVEAYDNAAHFLADEETEEQYNQVVKDTFQALKDAKGKYKSAQELVRLLNARIDLQKAQQRPQIQDENLKGIRQTQEAEDTVNRLNTATQSIDNSTRGFNANSNLNHLLGQNAFGKSTASQQNVENQTTKEEIKVGSEYNVEYNGEPATIKVTAIQPDPETGEVMAAVTTIINGKPTNIDTWVPLTDLEKRIRELQQPQKTSEILRPQDYEGTEYDWLKQYFGETTSKGVSRLEINSNLSDVENGTIYGTYDSDNAPTKAELESSPILLNVGSVYGNSTIHYQPYYIFKNLKDLNKFVRSNLGGFKGLNKNTGGDFEIASLLGNGKIVYKDGDWITPDGDVIADIDDIVKPNAMVGGNENGEHNRRKGKNDRRGIEQQDNTSSRSDNKNVRKLGKTNELSKEERGESDRQGDNKLYKKNYDKIVEKAKKKYGTTKDFKFGAYLLPDGTLLKLERNGRRGGHYMIEELGVTQQEFIDFANAIRLAPENGSIQFSNVPTSQQYAQIEDFVEYLHKNMPNDDYEVWVEIKGRREPFIFDSKKVGRAITQEIKNYFEETEQENTNGNETQKFSTDMESSPNSILEREIKKHEQNPNLQEEYEITSIREIRELTKQFLKGRLGIGQYRDKAYGVFYPLSNWVKLGQISNIDTLMHETGHFIDDEIAKELYKKYPEMQQELRDLCKLAFGKRYNGKRQLQLKEGFAEATRYFMVAPKELVKLAPNTASIIAQEFEKSPQLKELYPKLQKMFHDYINMSAQERVHSHVVTGTPKNEIYVEGRLKNFIREKIIRPVFNKLEAATKYDVEMEKAWKKKYGDKKAIPTTLKLFDNLRRANSSGESIKQQLQNGVYDPMDGKRVTKGLYRIMEPLREEAKQNHKEAGMTYDKYLNKRLNDLVDLGLSERTIELAKRSVDEGQIYETGIRLNDAKNVVEKFKNDTLLHDTLKEIRGVGSDIIDYAVKKGVIKQSAASEIKKKNIFYMPLNRILEGYGSFGSSTNQGATGEAIKPLKGSDRDIQNPLESLVGNWARVLKVIDDNFVRQQLVKVAHEVGDYGDFFTEVSPLMKYQGEVSLEKFKDFLEFNLSPKEFANLDLDETYKLFVPEKADPNKMTISYLQNGVRKYIKFADNDFGKPLFNILSNLNAKQSNQLLNTISLFNQGIRYGATTMNPFFAIGNTMSDQLQAFLYSDGLIFPVINSIFDAVRLGKARAFNSFGVSNLSQKRLAELYRVYKESGASLSGKYKLAEEEVMKTLPDIYGLSNKALFGSEGKLNKLKDVGKAIRNFLEYLPEYSEEMTRFGEFVRVYEKLVKDGMKPSQAKLEAGIKAKEITQDFSIQGELMQYLNKAIPFSAAKVGGLYRFAQEFRRHPGRLSMRMGILIGMAMLLAEARHRDDEAEDYYEELNNRKKFDNFIFPIGGSEPFTLKKPQGTPRYFINLAEYIYDLATGYIPEGEEQKRFKDWLTLSLSDQFPLISSPTEMIPGFVQPLLENTLNYDLYYGSKIVPQELEKLDPRHQYNEYTSEFSKAIGNMFNISPMKLDNFISGTFAGMGSATLDFTDKIYDIVTGNDTRAPSQNYLESRFRADVYRSSESVNRVYDKLEEYEREDAEGRLTTEQQAEYEDLKSAKTTFNKISKQMKEIRNDNSMTSDQKKLELDKLYELRTDVARYYLGKDLLNEENKDQVEVYKYYPSSSTYKYKVGNKTVEVSFEDDKTQKEYANLLKKEYEKELVKLKRSSKYRKANDKERQELEKNLLSNTRQKVNETMKERVYRRQKRGA